MLKLQIDKKLLISSLEPTQLIVERRSTMPILSNVLIEASDSGDIEFFSTDLEIGVKSKTSGDVESGGSLTVPAKKLFEFCRSLPDGLITIEEIDNFSVQIVGGASKFKIGGLNPDDFPSVSNFDEADFVAVSADVLSSLIARTHYAVSTDETRHNLNGIHFVAGEEKGFARMVSTDGHRLAKMDGKLSDEELSFLADGVILPRKGVNEMRKLLEAAASGDQFLLSRVGNQVVVRSDGTTVSMRMIEGDFPKWETTVPAGNENIITVNKSKLTEVLKRTLLMSSDRYHLVVFSLEGSSLTISCSNPDMGEISEFTETIEVTYDGSELEIGFNPRYLIDVIGTISSPDIVIKMGEELDPSVIQDKETDDFYGLIMPMRI